MQTCQPVGQASRQTRSWPVRSSVHASAALMHTPTAHTRLCGVMHSLLVMALREHLNRVAGCSARSGRAMLSTDDLSLRVGAAE